MFHCVPCADVWNSYISHWYPLVRFDSVRLFSAGYGLNSVFLVAVKHDIAPDAWLIFPAHWALTSEHLPFTSFFVPHKMNRYSAKQCKTHQNNQFALGGTSCSGLNEARSCFFYRNCRKELKRYWPKESRWGRRVSWWPNSHGETPIAATIAGWFICWKIHL